MVQRSVLDSAGVIRRNECSQSLDRLYSKPFGDETTFHQSEDAIHNERHQRRRDRPVKDSDRIGQLDALQN